jgi:superfamily II DNA or RNA helicase
MTIIAISGKPVFAHVILMLGFSMWKIKMKITVNHQAIVTDCKAGTFTEIMEQLTFDNPAYLENEKRNFSNYKTPRLIECFTPFPGGLSFPRGFSKRAGQIARKYGELVEGDDRRRVFPSVEMQFTGILKPFQQAAVNDVLARPFGTLQAPTGSGKTVMGLAIVAIRQQPALVVVHTGELLRQWIDRIETFLGIPREEIGVIGGGKMRVGNRITVALVQSLCKCTADVFEHIGFLIVDECHRCPSRTFLNVVTAFDCQYMLGLSATPWRRARLTRLIHYYLGDEIHRVDGEHLIKNGDICKATVETIETQFRTVLDASSQYSKMLSQLCEDERRNSLVASHAASEAKDNAGITLILSDRKSHCEALRAALSTKGVESDILTGDVSKKNRIELTGKLADGRCKVLIGTSQLLSEGFDCPSISSILLSTPMKWQGRVIQSIGRALRPAVGKDHARIIDFNDTHVGVLAAGAKSRARTFSQMPGVAMEDTHA